MLESVISRNGTTVSYDTYGSGPRLVLVHGGFSDHITNWQEVKSLLQDRFSVYSVARRGRGKTTATIGHSIADEVADVVAVLGTIGEPAFLLGHSYGAHCALGAAAEYPAGVRKLILYEPPEPHLITPENLREIERLAQREDWDSLVETFLLNVLKVSSAEVEEMRATPFWNVWTSDATPSLNDLRALANHQFNPEDYRSLNMAIILLIGTESPRDLYVTDTLAGVLPDSRIVELKGQAHECMTMAPEQFVQTISQFLLT